MASLILKISYIYNWRHFYIGDMFLFAVPAGSRLIYQPYIWVDTPTCDATIGKILKWLVMWGMCTWVRSVHVIGSYLSVIGTGLAAALQRPSILLALLIFTILLIVEMFKSLGSSGTSEASSDLYASEVIVTVLLLYYLQSVLMSFNISPCMFLINVLEWYLVFWTRWVFLWVQALIQNTRLMSHGYPGS